MSTSYPTPPRLRMLVVDQEVAIRFALSDYFRGQGFEVDAADGAEEVDAWLRQSHYEVVITDLQPQHPLSVAHRVRRVSPGTVVCLLAPPLSAEETRTAMLAADVVMTRPRPLPEIAALVQALLTPTVHDPSHAG